MEPADQVSTRSPVPARFVLAFVHFLFAECSLETVVAQAAEVSDPVNAGGTVATRHRGTFVYVRLAITAVVPNRADTFVRSANVAAMTTVEACKTCATNS